MDWAAWGPTLTTLAMWVFFGGIAWNKLSNHEKRLDEHDEQLEERTRDIIVNSLDIRELKAWKDGYAAARAKYQPSHAGGD